MKNRPNTSATTFKQNNQKPLITQQNDIEPRFTLLLQFTTYIKHSTKFRQSFLQHADRQQ